MSEEDNKPDSENPTDASNENVGMTIEEVAAQDTDAIPEPAPAPAPAPVPAPAPAPVPAPAPAPASVLPPLRMPDGTHGNINPEQWKLEQEKKIELHKTRKVERRKYRIQKRRYEILDKIRINCVNLTAYHNHRYHLYKNLLFSIFRVPLIILNGVNSFFSVGLQHYMPQHQVSLINAVISLFCGILTSIELLLNLQKRMELELECAKEYYKVGVDIYTELCREPDDRGEAGDLDKFLREKHNLYQTLYQKSNAVNISEKDFDDEFELYMIQDDAMEAFYPDNDSISDYNDDVVNNRHRFALQRASTPRGSPRGGGGIDSSRKQQRGSGYRDNKTSSICPVCISNTITSCLFTIMYCCTGKQSTQRYTKKQRDHEMGQPDQLEYIDYESDDSYYGNDRVSYGRNTSSNIKREPSRNWSKAHRQETRNFAIRKKKKLSETLFG